MGASVPSLLHATRFKLETNLEILEALTRTWPIAQFFVELFKATYTPELFDGLLTSAVEACQARTRGGSYTPGGSSRPNCPYRRPKVQQVFLPQSRVVLQILARESQKRPTLMSRANNDGSNTTSRNDLQPSSDNMFTVHSETLSPLEDCEPTAILQNLQRIIGVGRSTGDCGERPT